MTTIRTMQFLRGRDTPVTADFAIGQRVRMHPATDAFMRGIRWVTEMNAFELAEIQPVVDAMVTWRTLGPSLRTLMHEHVMRALASVDREQERTTRVTPVARASAQAADVAMHYRRMLRDYHG